MYNAINAYFEYDNITICVGTMGTPLKKVSAIMMANNYAVKNEHPFIKWLLFSILKSGTTKADQTSVKSRRKYLNRVLIDSLAIDVMMRGYHFYLYYNIHK